ncbi:phage Gp37/Gp68 family protein [Fulvimarina endophytica]|uniref:Phage Gp37/Gp68 family protein n=1 Tax=Fulvimarina endophytica TaxID=2293836 RepID=A0A371X751_9HYPH|nr:phage Gp37/Gp68 family protein [Fulvimarina endophytica]RFC65037.1 phage Gp37/Gp68 family protein [Fulvimarina endophytica]
MADNTKIEWTDATWNPITGCSVVSPGCTNCYAMKLAGSRMKNHPSRAGLTRESKAGPVWTGEVRLNEQWLDQPLRWSKPRMIFVCAHGDLFAEGVPDEWIDRVFAVMALADHHRFQVLTKRPERMRKYLLSPEVKSRIAMAMAVYSSSATLDAIRRWSSLWGTRTAEGWPLPNVWLGVSVEDQTRADERIPILLDTPAALRWISAEPLLGPLDFCKTSAAMTFPNHPWRNGPILQGIDWIVAGGESGPGARPMHPDWIRSLRDQCEAAEVPFLFKQWGEWVPICEMEEEATNACYRSNRIAKDHEDQGTLDEVYGRRQIKPSHVLHRDGSRHGILEPMAFQAGTGAMTMFAIGKKAAGRTLGGVTHDGFPDARP